MREHCQIWYFCVQCIQRGLHCQIHVSVYVCSLPGGVTIARFLGLYDKSCVACGKAVKVKNSSDVYTCSTQNCTGHISVHVKGNITFNITAQVSPISIIWSLRHFALVFRGSRRP